MSNDRPAAKREGQTSPAAKREGQTSPAAKREGQTSPAAKREGQTSPAAKREGQTSPAAKREGQINPIARRGVCLVLAAPSGGGKTAIARRLVETDPDLQPSISMTTRAPRAGEQDGVDYHFRDQATFDRLVASGGFLEWAHVFDHCYGTPRAQVEAALAIGRDVVFDIDWQGHRSLLQALPEDVVGVFILPPSLGVLERRLRGRGDGEAALARRMARARDEISHWHEFSHAVLNQDFDRAVADMRAILHAARLERARQHGLADFVARLDD